MLCHRVAYIQGRPLILVSLDRITQGHGAFIGLSVLNAALCMCAQFKKNIGFCLTTSDSQAPAQSGLLFMVSRRRCKRIYNYIGTLARSFPYPGDGKRGAQQLWTVTVYCALQAPLEVILVETN